MSDDLSQIHRDLGAMQTDIKHLIEHVHKFSRRQSDIDNRLKTIEAGQNSNRSFIAGISVTVSAIVSLLIYFKTQILAYLSGG